ncbi:MAG: helix-turn-helix domain-containing protein [Sulfurimonas sp.]|nr:helix-turn-helix domain-containing protein [Sulfurimonas sp.]
MRYISLKQEVIQQLQEVIKTNKKHKSRMRAQALLLSNQGKKVQEIVEIIGYSQRTLYRWFDRFNQDNISTVHELAGRGRKPKLTIAKHESSIKMYIKNYNVNEILLALEKEFTTLEVSKRTLKRFFRKIGLSYKRAKRSL